MRTRSRIIVVIIVTLVLLIFVPPPFSFVMAAAVLIPFWILDKIKMQAKKKQNLESGWDTGDNNKK
jgi:chromate transport protein ChrA